RRQVWRLWRGRRVARRWWLWQRWRWWLQQRWRWRRRLRSRPRAARDVQRHVLELRQGGSGPLPPDERQARLLLGLLPQPAGRQRLLNPSSRRGSIEGPPNRETPTRVVSRPGASIRACGGRLSRLAPAGLRCRLRASLTHVDVRSLTVLPAALP